jgi:hypothetical protein
MEFRLHFVPGVSNEELADARPFEFVWECEVVDENGFEYVDRGGRAVVPLR